jgi:hypothetical protein
MSYPVRVFCKLMYANNGGVFTADGRPAVRACRFCGTAFDCGQCETYVVQARASCDRASDCAQCGIMQGWLQGLAEQGYEISWECQKCVKDTGHTPRRLEGYYQEGACPRVNPDTGEICGYETAFLQLVIRGGPP